MKKRTMQIRISEDTYKFLDSRLRERKQLSKSLEVSTVEEMVSLFLDSNCLDAGQISTELDEIIDYTCVAQDYFNYIYLKRFIRDVKAGKTQADREELKDAQEEVKNLRKDNDWLPTDPYNDGWLRFFGGWFFALEWIFKNDEDKT